MMKEIGDLGEVKMKEYISGSFFDWSLIDQKYPTENVVTLFREPVGRAVSHFYFMKTEDRATEMESREQSISKRTIRTVPYLVPAVF